MKIFGVKLLFKYNMQDPLISNFLIIMATYISGAGTGFLFWLLAAKFYLPSEVGLATAIISSMNILIIVSRLGLDTSIIRFFPIQNKSKIMNTSITVSTIFAMIIGIIYIINIDLFTPELQLLKSPLYAILFLIFLSANSITVMTGISFIAMRKSSFQLIQNLSIGLRIVFVIPLVVLGVYGIFSSVGISFIFASIVALFFLRKNGIIPRITIDSYFLKESFHYLGGNYITSLFTNTPTILLPIIALNIVGPEESAYYFISYSIASILFMIPNAISMSLFVEGSHGVNLRNTVFKSILIIFLILIPGVILFYAFGESILNLIGDSYSNNGLEVLQSMIIASIFSSFNNIYCSICKVRNNMFKLIILSVIMASTLVCFSYIYMKSYGIVGIGYAWIVSSIIGNVAIILTLYREHKMFVAR